MVNRDHIAAIIAALRVAAASRAASGQTPGDAAIDRDGQDCRSGL
jgi:hypothetical protein